MYTCLAASLRACRNGSIIVYDAAYALYISNPDCPKTIYEIPGVGAMPCHAIPCSPPVHCGALTQRD